MGVAEDVAAATAVVSAVEGRERLRACWSVAEG